MHLQCVCTALALRLRCDSTVFALRLRDARVALAMRCRCPCGTLALRLRCNCSAACTAIALRLTYTHDAHARCARFANFVCMWPETGSILRGQKHRLEVGPPLFPLRSLHSQLYYFMRRNSIRGRLAANARLSACIKFSVWDIKRKPHPMSSDLRMFSNPIIH